MAWLLDTNAWIHYLKNPASRVRVELEQRRPNEIVTCAVVKAELLHGAMKYGVPDRRASIVRETLSLYRPCHSMTLRRSTTPASGTNWSNRANALGRMIFSSRQLAWQTIARW